MTLSSIKIQFGSMTGPMMSSDIFQKINSHTRQTSQVQTCPLKSLEQVRKRLVDLFTCREYVLHRQSRSA